MAKKEILDRDLTDPEIQARKARLKKQNLEIETRQLFNQKVKLLKDNHESKRAAEKQSKVLKDIQKKTSEIIKKNKVEENSLNQKKKDVEKTIKKNEKILQDTDSAKDKNDNDRHINKLAERSLKARIKQLGFDKANLSTDNIHFDKMMLRLTKAEVKVNDNEKIIDEKLKLIETKLEEADVTLTKVYELKKTVEDKISENKNTKLVLAEKGQILDSKAKNLDSREEEIDLKIDKHIQAKETFETKERGLARSYADLETKKDEVKVLELRVRKLIRTKDLGKELKALEKDLKK